MYLTAVCQSPVNLHRRATQTIKIMKLFTVFMIAACLQVHAESFAQKVTIKKNNTSIQKIFEDIRKQTGYQFLYADEILKQAKPISIAVSNEKLETVLAICFKDQLLEYTISEKTIIVKPKVLLPSLQVVQPTLAPMPPPDIRGRVTDNSGKPLADV
jgi:TonB-dependent starch-binding outer membrane protein SusC